MSNISIEKEETVNHPKHYNKHPSGIECIDLVEWFSFNFGNGIKYLWRAGLKPNTDRVEDYAKARFYLDREINKRLSIWLQVKKFIRSYFLVQQKSISEQEIIDMCKKVIVSDPSSCLAAVLFAYISKKNPLDVFDAWMLKNKSE